MKEEKLKGGGLVWILILVEKKTLTFLSKPLKVGFLNPYYTDISGTLDLQNLHGLVIGNKTIAYTKGPY